MAQSKSEPAPGALTELGRRLRTLRELRAQLSGPEVSEKRGVDPGTLSRVENGRRLPNRDLVLGLLTLYQATEREHEELLSLLSTAELEAKRRRRPAWWRRFLPLLSLMGFDGFLRLERLASGVANYESKIVHGLLQTHAYAEAVIRAMRPDLPPGQVLDLVEVRMGRQQSVLAGDLRLFSAVIDEAALRQPGIPLEVMLGQLRHLLEVSTNPKVELRILTADVGLHPGLAGPFVLMEFPGSDQDVVWIELAQKSLHFDSDEDLRFYRELFDGLKRKALDPARSRVHIETMIKEFSR